MDLFGDLSPKHRFLGLSLTSHPLWTSGSLKPMSLRNAWSHSYMLKIVLEHIPDAHRPQVQVPEASYARPELFSGLIKMNK